MCFELTAALRLYRTYSWNASFTYPPLVFTSYSRVRLLSFSVNNSSGGASPACGSTSHRQRPKVRWLVSTAPGRVCFIHGLTSHVSCAQPQDHVLRNQSVGSRCSGARSGPRLVTVSLIRTSFGERFAYSTKTSKYLSS